MKNEIELMKEMVESLKTEDAQIGEKMVQLLERVVQQRNAYSLLLDLAKERHNLDLRKIYGKSSEKRDTPTPDGDSPLNESEKTVDDHKNEEKKKNARKNKKNEKKRKSGPDKGSEQQRIDWDDADVEHIFVDNKSDLPEGEWVETDKEIIVRRIEVITTIKKKVYHFKVFQKKDHYDIDGNPVTYAPGYEEVDRPRSFFSPSLTASLIYSKYRLFLPLYRFEKMLEEHNVPIARYQLARETMRVADNLKPLYELMLSLVRQGVGYVDGTGWRTINSQSDNKKCNIITFANRMQNLVTYIYTLDKSKETMAREVFGKGYKGFAHCDAAPEWLSISVDKGKKVKESDEFKQFLEGFEFTPILCWYHARRKFIDAEKDKRANFYIEQLQKLAKIERELVDAKANYDEIHRTRLEKSKPLVDKIFQTAKEQLPGAVPRSLFHRALTYLIENEKGLRRFLENGEFAISNNFSERLIKSVVMGRNNSLFSNTDSGAECSCILYSIVVSAYLNGLDVLNYLIHLLTNFDYDHLSKYLPNSPEMREKFTIRDPIDMNIVEITNNSEE